MCKFTSVQLHIWGLFGFIQMVLLSGPHWPPGPLPEYRSKGSLSNLLHPLLFSPPPTDPAVINGQSSVPHPSCFRLPSFCFYGSVSYPFLSLTQNTCFFHSMFCGREKMCDREMCSIAVVKYHHISDLTVDQPHDCDYAINKQDVSIWYFHKGWMCYALWFCVAATGTENIVRVEECILLNIFKS